MLYTVEFYELVLSRLGVGGLMVAQSGPTGPTNVKEVFTSISKTMRRVFAHTSGYRVNVPSFGTMWGFVTCGGADAPVVSELEVDDIDTRIAARLASDLRYYDGVAHRGMFSLPKYIRVAVDGETRVITKDNPLYAI